MLMSGLPSWLPPNQAHSKSPFSSKHKFEAWHCAVAAGRNDSCRLYGELTDVIVVSAELDVSRCVTVAMLAGRVYMLQLFNSCAERFQIKVSCHVTRPFQTDRRHRFQKFTDTKPV